MIVFVENVKKHTTVNFPYPSLFKLKSRLYIKQDEVDRKLLLVVCFQLDKTTWQRQVDPRMKVAWFAEDLNDNTVSDVITQGQLL